MGPCSRWPMKSEPYHKPGRHLPVDVTRTQGTRRLTVLTRPNYGVLRRYSANEQHAGDAYTGNLNSSSYKCSTGIRTTAGNMEGSRPPEYTPVPYRYAERTGFAPSCGFPYLPLPITFRTATYQRNQLLHTAASYTASTLVSSSLHHSMHLRTNPTLSTSLPTRSSNTPWLATSWTLPGPATPPPTHQPISWAPLLLVHPHTSSHRCTPNVSSRIRTAQHAHSLATCHASAATPCVALHSTNTIICRHLPQIHSFEATRDAHSGCVSTGLAGAAAHSMQQQLHCPSAVRRRHHR